MSDDLGSASARLIALGPAPELEPLRAHMTIEEYEALVSMLEQRCERYRHALHAIRDEIIYGGGDMIEEPDIDKLHDIARNALEGKDDAL